MHQSSDASYGSTYSTNTQAPPPIDTGQSHGALHHHHNNKQSRRHSLCSNSTDLSAGRLSLHSMGGGSGVGIGNPMYDIPPEPHPDYNMEDGLHGNGDVASFSTPSAYKNPVFDDDDSGLVRNDYFYNL